MRRVRAGGLLAQPVNRLLAVSFVLVALVPVSFWGVKLYDAAWEDARREIREKHQLIARNLAAPISVYVDSQRAALRLVGLSLERLDPRQASPQRIHRHLRADLERLDGIRSLTLVAPDGRAVAGTHVPLGEDRAGQVFAEEACFLSTRRTGQPAISGIKASPLSGEPTIVLSHPIRPDGVAAPYVVLAELDIGLIEELRRNVKFGKRGHSAIVDQHGRVIAHPNPEWVAQMRDLSDWPVVQRMMAGETGMSEFYSPFIDAQMVAGYASVPDVGWGIMVPQPKGEVAGHVNALLYGQLRWGGIGLILGLALAVVLGRWITNPLNRLARGASEVGQRGFEGRLPVVSAHAPREVQALSGNIDRLIDGLQASRQRYDELNRSLQRRVDEATEDLRAANAQLEELARVDHLTGVANRRYFEGILLQGTGRRRADEGPLCLMLIDLDNFKQINDAYGHAAGDAVLMQLAALLSRNTRHGDVVARYGGDEFAVQMHCDYGSARERAEHVLEAVEAHRFYWGSDQINVTVSIGLLCRPAHAQVEADRLLQRVDQAMYRAKQAGRNRVADIVLDEASEGDE